MVDKVPYSPRSITKHEADINLLLALRGFEEPQLERSATSV